MANREFLKSLRENNEFVSVFEEHLKENFSLVNWVFWKKLTDLVDPIFKEENIYENMKNILNQHLLDSSREEVNLFKK